MHQRSYILDNRVFPVMYQQLVFVSFLLQHGSRLLKEMVFPREAQLAFGLLIGQNKPFKDIFFKH